MFISAVGVAVTAATAALLGILDDAELGAAAAGVVVHGERVAVLVDVPRLARDLYFLRDKDAAPGRGKDGPEDGHAGADAGGVDLECCE